MLLTTIVGGAQILIWDGAYGAQRSRLDSRNANDSGDELRFLVSWMKVKACTIRSG